MIYFSELPTPQAKFVSGTYAEFELVTGCNLISGTEEENLDSIFDEKSNAHLHLGGEREKWFLRKESMAISILPGFGTRSAKLQRRRFSRRRFSRHRFRGHRFSGRSRFSGGRAAALLAPGQRRGEDLAAGWAGRV